MTKYLEVQENKTKDTVLCEMIRFQTDRGLNKKDFNIDDELLNIIEEMLEAFALRVETLTPAERKVLQYYIEGYTIQEIASLLYISIGTARKHNTNMNRKLGITAREELMLYIDLFRKCNQLDKLTYTRTE